MPIIAYPLDPSITIADLKPSIREKTRKQRGAEQPQEPTKTAGDRYVYQIDREKSFAKTQKAVESRCFDNPDPKLKIDDWIRVAEETFSSPSKKERGEKGSVFVVEEHDNNSSRASAVPEVLSGALLAGRERCKS